MVLQKSPKATIVIDGRIQYNAQEVSYDFSNGVEIIQTLSNSFAGIGTAKKELNVTFKSAVFVSADGPEFNVTKAVNDLSEVTIDIIIGKMQYNGIGVFVKGSLSADGSGTILNGELRCEPKPME